MTKPGRPKKPAKERKAKSLHVRLTAQELRAIERKAQSEGVKPSTWARKHLTDPK